MATLSRLMPHVRYERADIHDAFLSLQCTLIGWQSLGNKGTKA